MGFAICGALPDGWLLTAAERYGKARSALDASPLPFPVRLPIKRMNSALGSGDRAEIS